MVNGSGIAKILKPPQNFESVYQGQARTVPIPFVEANENGDFVAPDPLAGTAGVDSNLLRFVPVPIGSTVLFLIPKALYSTNAEKLYLYDIRWRLRSTDDYQALAAQGKATAPFSMNGTNGAPSAGAPRRVIPAYTSEQVTPASVGSTARSLISAGIQAAISQGVYDPATVGGGDGAFGLTYYEPVLRACIGNEIGIAASFATGDWAFSDTDPTTGDAGFSNVFGTNQAGPPHPFYPGVGIVLVVLDRNTYP